MTHDPAAPVATTFAPRPPDNARGMALMFAGFFAFAGVDAMAKLLAAEMNPLQVVWTRQLGLLAGVLVLLAVKGPGLLRSARPGLQVFRGALAAGSATLFVAAVRFVPLADAVAVTFIAPFVVTLLGALVLREPVGPHRWAAVAIGFAGTLIIVRPGAGVIHPAILLVIIAATLFAGRQVVSRAIAPHDPTVTTIAYTALVGSTLLTLPLPFVWQSPAGHHLLLMVGFAILAGLGELLIILALEHAHAVVVAPVHYSLIVWSTMYGWLIFDQLPDAWTWLGAAVIIVSGLYTMHRERLAGRRKAAKNAPAT